MTPSNPTNIQAYFGVTFSKQHDELLADSSICFLNLELVCYYKESYS